MALQQRLFNYYHYVYTVISLCAATYIVIRKNIPVYCLYNVCSSIVVLFDYLVCIRAYQCQYFR